MPPKTRMCACGCNEVIDVTRSPRKKYFNDVCRARASKRRQAVLAKKGANSPITPAMQRFRELRESEDDYVREVLSDVVRDLVTEAVQDNLRGAAEILTGLMPVALASLADDMHQGDEYLRQKARDTILKYAIQFRDVPGKGEDLGQINVFTSMPLPNTPLGHAVAEEVITIEADAEAREIEAFEQDWPMCDRCKERRHPDNLHQSGRSDQMMCSGCRLTLQLGRGDAVLPADPEAAGGDDV